MLGAIRLYVHVALTQAAYLYAIWAVLRERKRTTVSAVRDSPDGGHTAPTKECVTLGTDSLKLCIMLAALGGLSSFGADVLPMFPECRLIVTYLLLFAPPFTQREVYDKAFSPLLVKVGNVVASTQNSEFMTRRVCLFVVYRLVSLSIAIMNFVHRCGTLEADAVKDILGGLVFARRALDDVAAQQRAGGAGSPVFVGSLLSALTRASQDAASGSATSDASYTFSATGDGGSSATMSTEGLTDAATFGSMSGDDAAPTGSVLSAVEIVSGVSKRKKKR